MVYLHETEALNAIVAVYEEAVGIYERTGDKVPLTKLALEVAETADMLMVKSGQIVSELSDKDLEEINQLNAE